jgi:hypothetical protein
MIDEELDRLLSEEPEIEPSAGFAMSVMKAVRTEAATPPPISFPWFCAAPLVACWGLLGAAIIATLFRPLGKPLVPTFHLRVDWTALLSRFTAVLSVIASVEGISIAIALLIAAASLSVSWRMTRWN